MEPMAFAKDQRAHTTVAVSAEKSKDASLVATLDQQAAIAIYLAKAARSPRDSTSSTLATQYNITMKAVRDVWNLRTWPWATMPYWTRSDYEKFMRKHLCTQCHSRGVRSLLSACKKCAGPRRRGRPFQGKSSSTSGQQPRTAPYEPDMGHSPGIHPSAGTRLSTFSRPSASTHPTTWHAGIPLEPSQGEEDQTADKRASLLRSTHSQPYGDAPVYIPVEPSVKLIQCVFDLPFEEAGASLGISPSFLEQPCRRFGLDQWPHNKRPARGTTPQRRYGDLDDWLRQADISIDTHQVQQGEENQSAVVKLVNYEARARAWALQPQRRQS